MYGAPGAYEPSEGWQDLENVQPCMYLDTAVHLRGRCSMCSDYGVTSEW